MMNLCLAMKLLIPFIRNALEDISATVSHTSALRLLSDLQIK